MIPGSGRRSLRLLLAVGVVCSTAWAPQAVGQTSAGVSPLSSGLPELDRASMVFDPLDNFSVLFGTSGTQDAGQTWTLSGTSWTQSSSIAEPPATNAPLMVYDESGRAVLVLVSHQTWTFSRGQWSNLTGTVGSYTGGYAVQAAYDPVLNATAVMVLNFTSFQTYFWLYSQGVWRNATQAFEPSGSLIWDTTAGELLSVGCQNVWTFQARWVSLPVTGSTCDTGGVSWVDNPEVGGLLGLSSGTGVWSGTGTNGITWTFSGGLLTGKNLTPTPPYAYGELTYDSVAHRVVYYTGNYWGSATTSQTWVFSDGEWRNVTSLPPSASSGEFWPAVLATIVVVLIAAPALAVLLRRRRRRRQRSAVVGERDMGLP